MEKDTIDPSYHEVATSPYWTDQQIAVRLGELTLNLGEIEKPSGEYFAAQKEIDALAFEQHVREAS